MLAVVSAYGQILKDQPKVDISKMEVWVRPDGGSFEVGFLFPAPEWVDHAGTKMRVNTFDPYNGKYGVPVTYVINAKTLKVIKHYYSR